MNASWKGSGRPWEFPVSFSLTTKIKLAFKFKACLSGRGMGQPIRELFGEGYMLLMIGLNGPKGPGGGYTLDCVTTYKLSRRYNG